MRSSTVFGPGLPLLAAFAIAACSGGTDNNDIIDPNDCEATISGAPAAYASVNGTFDCLVVALYGTAGNQASIAVTVTTPITNAVVCFTGEVTVSTHTATDADAACGSSVSSGAAIWGVTAGGGSWTLRLTAVSTAVTNASGKTYNIEGTFDATLLPLGGPATNNLTLHAVF